MDYIWKDLMALKVPIYFSDERELTTFCLTQILELILSWNNLTMSKFFKFLPNHVHGIFSRAVSRILGGHYYFKWWLAFSHAASMVVCEEENVEFLKPQSNPLKSYAEETNTPQSSS